jgi:hypothetical protein
MAMVISENSDKGADDAVEQLESTLTEQQVRAQEARERKLFGEGGDVQKHLPEQLAQLEQENYRRLLPGYVQMFLETAVPLLQLAIDGNANELFTFKALTPSSMDLIFPLLERYPAELRERFSVHKPSETEKAIFLRPGEPVFDRLVALITSRYSNDALKGGVFVDPYATKPYLFHIAQVTVLRKADITIPPLETDEIIEKRLVGLRQEADGSIIECPVEHLLILKGRDRYPDGYSDLVARAEALREISRSFVIEKIERQLVDKHREMIRSTLQERETFIKRGYSYLASEMAEKRRRLQDKAASGDAKAKGDLTKIKQSQRDLNIRRDQHIQTLRKEPEFIIPGEMSFLTHVLIIPSNDPEDRRRNDKEIEKIAIRVAWSYEESLGANVRDVSTPEMARGANLTDNPGFDLLSRRSEKEERLIEVKGRAQIGDVELSENEWAKASNLKDRYWLYVVYNCASPYPQLIRVQNPFKQLLSTPRGGVIIDEKSIIAAGDSGA